MRKNILETPPLAQELGCPNIFQLSHVDFNPHIPSNHTTDSPTTTLWYLKTIAYLGHFNYHLLDHLRSCSHLNLIRVNKNKYHDARLKHMACMYLIIYYIVDFACIGFMLRRPTFWRPYLEGPYYLLGVLPIYKALTLRATRDYNKYDI